MCLSLHFYVNVELNFSKYYTFFMGFFYLRGYLFNRDTSQQIKKNFFFYFNVFCNYVKQILFLY